MSEKKDAKKVKIIKEGGYKPREEPRTPRPKPPKKEKK